MKRVLVFLKQLRIGIEQTLETVVRLMLYSALLLSLMVLPLRSQLHLHLLTSMVDSLQICEKFLWIYLDIELQLVFVAVLINFEKPSQI